MLKRDSIAEIELLISRYPILTPIEASITQSVELLATSVQSGGKVLVCGNGGSAADSLHIIGELMKGFVLKRKMAPELQERFIKNYPEDAEYYVQNLQGAVPAISLVNEVALTTAFGNDQSSELAFAQQVLGYGKPGDVLLAISTSGNSANVFHAARVARVMGVKVISLTGETGGRLRALSNILLNVPGNCTYQIQELHLPVYHAICLALEQELFGQEE